MADRPRVTPHSRVLTVLFGACLFALLLPRPAIGADPVVHPDWFKHSFYELPAELTEARQAGKQGILLFFHTPTCSYCKALLSKTFANDAVARRLSARFDVIALDVISDVQVTGFDGKHYWAKEFAVNQKATFTPTLIFYGHDGERLLRLVGYTPPEKMLGVLEYLNDKRDKNQSLRAYLAQRGSPASVKVEATTLPDDPLFAHPPYILDRRGGASDRPLLVLFERNGSESCARFRRIALGAAEVRRLLERYEVVRLNMNSTTGVITPAGNRITAAQWADELELLHAPALVFFDERGREVLRVDSELLIDAQGQAVEGRNPEFIGNVAARLRYVLQKDYRDYPQFQQWRKQQLSRAGQD